ncbi:hypothetical protein BCR32DRAFT_248117 [Anaeromyces robustus]|uniref:CCHC-type domain-containing protein n=1 Tax=Anaeromyces robustus TaxID=1754192 RepID=A0A1Y1WUH9_9FUNG|nr:hypothetical protein BCR32DRAFT_248117 [Anaeromyces robustus]|eukprot:ORX77201.1 hypothetical protein BCR32DRAFT_248117 [Anaeromyces robustus]
MTSRSESNNLTTTSVGEPPVGITLSMYLTNIILLLIKHLDLTIIKPKLPSFNNGVARTIVINSLNKQNPDDYNTTMNKLREHYKSSLPKNSRLLELSTITIKRGESVAEFNTRFDTLLNKVNVSLTEEVIISYYINAFRNFTRTYESLLEAEPNSLEEAKKITTKKEKIYNLVGSNKTKARSFPNNSNRNYIESNSQKNNDKAYNGNHNNFNRNNFSNNSNRNYYNYNNNNGSNTNKNFNPNTNYTKFNNVNQGTEYRRNSLKYPQNTNEELQEITRKLADLKINVCLNCQRIGHVQENCPELFMYLLDRRYFSG